MEERLVGRCLKEEELLEDCYDVAIAPASAVGDEWQPNSSCKDAPRLYYPFPLAQLAGWRRSRAETR